VIPILYRQWERGACAVKTCSDWTVLLKVWATLYMHVAGAILFKKLRRAVQMVVLPPARMLESIGLFLGFTCLPMKVVQRQWAVTGVWRFTSSPFSPCSLQCPHA